MNAKNFLYSKWNLPHKREWFSKLFFFSLILLECVCLSVFTVTPDSKTQAKRMVCMHRERKSDGSEETSEREKGEWDRKCVRVSMSMSESRHYEREHIYTRHCIAVDTLQFNAWLMYEYTRWMYLYIHIIDVVHVYTRYSYYVHQKPECVCVCTRKRNINSNDAAFAI